MHPEISNKPATDRLSFISMLWTTKGTLPPMLAQTRNIQETFVALGVGIGHITHPHQATHSNKIPVVDSEGFNKIERR